MSILILATKIASMETTLGGLVRYLREDRGWDQEELGAKIGRPKSWVSNLETGKKKNLPEPHELRALGKVLGVSTIDLLRAAGFVSDEDLDSSAVSEMATRLIARIRQPAISDDTAKTALRMINAMEPREEPKT